MIRLYWLLFTKNGAYWVSMLLFKFWSIWEVVRMIALCLAELAVEIAAVIFVIRLFV